MGYGWLEVLDGVTEVVETVKGTVGDKVVREDVWQDGGVPAQGRAAAPVLRRPQWPAELWPSQRTQSGGAPRLSGSWKA